jgi:two-component sensor histidine kinase
MIRNDVLATLFFALTLIGGLATFSYQDRQATLRAAEAWTSSVSRMMGAHAESAIESAASRAADIKTMVAAWNFEDNAQAYAIFHEMHAATSSPTIGAVAVVDANGISRLNSFGFPSAKVDVSARPYYREHRSGNVGPLILGDDTPGPISGEHRFTYTEAVRNEAGELHAIIVIIIFNRIFNGLYTEVATWPAARATLYNDRGDVLARMHDEAPGTAEYVADLLDHARLEPMGVAVIHDGDEHRLASWNKVEGPVVLIANTSQDVSSALSGWWGRTLTLGLVGLALLTSFALQMRTMRHAKVATETADFYRTSVAEVHHRVKNALQLSISMLNIRSRAHQDPEVKALLTKLAGQLAAIAELQDLLQHDTSLHEVDLCDLMERLCSHLRKAATGRTIIFRTSEEFCRMETGRATYTAIIANELLTNAMKHARNNITLLLECEDDHVLLTVSDDGSGLPDGFVPTAQDGFGLRAIAMIAERIGGTISMENGRNGGVVANLKLPVTG